MRRTRFKSSAQFGDREAAMAVAPLADAKSPARRARSRILGVAFGSVAPSRGMTVTADGTGGWRPGGVHDRASGTHVPRRSSAT
jgi:hypothetical protein